MKPSMAQTLFEAAPVETVPEDQAAKAMIDKLLKVRRSLSPAEEQFGLPRLNLLIDEFRSLVRATPTQREEMVLYAIERQGATTETEIAEDTRLHRSKVRDLVAGLMEKGVLYQVSRTVIGSDRPQFAIKSKRVKTPEAE
jgi:predicted HTH transcriptional regulator